MNSGEKVSRTGKGRDLEKEVRETFSEFGINPRVDPVRLGPAGHKWNIHSYAADAGSTVERYLTEYAWLSVAHKLGPLDRIEVVEETGEWCATIVVRSIGAAGVVVGLIHYAEIGGAGPRGAKPELGSGPEVKHMGIHHNWCVCDGDRILMSHLPTETAAQQWLHQYCAVTPGEAA